MGNSSDRYIVAGSDPAGLEAFLESLGADRRYARRILYWVYVRRIASFHEIDDIPRKILDLLSLRALPGLTPPVASERSADGSVKYLFRSSGGALHETVFLPDGKRQTVCISVQSGCRMGCRFCATGHYGWRGNLTAAEIVNQVISIPYEVTHIVMMGMGEPGDNIDEVTRACRIITAEWGLAAGRRRVTVSTVGVPSATERLLGETECNITLSLHSPFPDERAGVIPAERRWPFAETLRLLSGYDNRRKRRFTVAYVMMKGVNDTPRHLEELIRLLAGTAIRVNLLPYHPVTGSEVTGTPLPEMMSFRHELVMAGISASVRRSRGEDIAAACGMLAAKTGSNGESFM